MKSKSSSKQTKNDIDDDLLIDFGNDKSKAKKNPEEDSWASWENDAWDSLNK